jgi:hypothetical protein
MKNLIKLFLYTSFIGAAVFPIYAFAAVDSGSEIAGEGTGTISGWTISDIHYQLGNDPSLVNGVSFDLDAPASSVSISMSSTSTVYTSCTHVHGYRWQCDLVLAIPVSSLDEVRVVAVGN